MAQGLTADEIAALWAPRTAAQIAATWYPPNLSPDPNGTGSHGGWLPNGPTWDRAVNLPVPAPHPRGIQTAARFHPTTPNREAASTYALDSLFATGPARYVSTWVYTTEPGLEAHQQYGTDPWTPLPVGVWTQVTNPDIIPANTYQGLFVRKVDPGQLAPVTANVWFTGAWAAATLPPVGIPLTADGIAALYLKSLTPGGALDIDTLSANLFLSATDYDIREDATTLTVHSDEARAFLLRLVRTAPLAFGSLALRTVVSQALEFIGANLLEGPQNPTLTEPAIWQPRATLWEFLEPLCTSTASRLWCDESRGWHLDPIDAIRAGQLTLSDKTTVLDASPVVDLDGEWCDSVVVEYRWRDTAGIQQSRVDVAGVAVPHVTASVLYDNTVYPGPGAAQVILNRRALKGTVIPLRAVNDLRARPNQALVALVAPLAQQSGLVQRVRWSYPDGVMAVDGYAFEAVSNQSVRAIPESYQTDQLPGLTKNLDPRGM